MLRKFKIENGKLVENGHEDCPVLMYINPDEAEKKFLLEGLLIDEHTMNSALDPNELGRIEFESNHNAIIIKRPKRYSSEDNFLLKISSVGLFFFPDKIVILLTEDTPLFEGRTFTKIRSNPDLLLKLIHRCILHFEEHLQVISKISNELEREINQALSNRDLLHMFNLEKSLVYYLNAIGSNGRVIDKMKSNPLKFNFSPEDNELLEDVIIENTQCYEQARTYSEVLSGMMDAWVSIVSNNLNIRIKTLTVLMICIMVPTLVISAFSMNVKMPFPEGSPISFWIIIGMAVASILGVVFIQRHHKW